MRLVVGLILSGLGILAFIQACLIHHALGSAYTVPIPIEPAGKHTLVLRALPYEEMEIALRHKKGGKVSDLFASRDAALVYRWKLDGDESMGRVEHQPDENLLGLFLLRGSDIKGPMKLEFEVMPETAPSLGECELAIQHTGI